MTTATNRYALTLGEQSEIHVGCQIHGNGLALHGFSVAEMKGWKEKLGERAKLVMLSDVLPVEHRSENEAAVLHIRQGVALLMGEPTYADQMLKEQNAVVYDKFYFDRRRQRKLKKIARHNAVFGDKHVEPSEDYKQSTVIAYDEVPLFKKLRERLPEVLGEKARELNSEGNHYYNGKSGIGYHGDSERKRVVCCSLGDSTVLRFYWRRPRESDVGSEVFEFPIQHGDIYIMSEKASGYDWRMRSRYRLVHAAGTASYVETKKKKSKKKQVLAGGKRKMGESPEAARKHVS
jgi:alkylated DNA repair dioxygenase AlkB